MSHFPQPPPRFQRKCRAPNHRAPNPPELPTTVVSAGNFLRSSVRETQRVLEMKRGLNVNGLVGDPISWANKMPTGTWSQKLDWSQKNVNFGLVFLLENRSCGDMKRMETKKQTHCLRNDCFGDSLPTPWRASTEVSNGSHEVAPFWAEGHGVRRKFFLMKRMFAKKVWMIHTLLFINSLFPLSISFVSLNF